MSKVIYNNIMDFKHKIAKIRILINSWFKRNLSAEYSDAIREA